MMTAVVAAALAVLAPAAADSGVPTPLKQLEAGVDAVDVLCNEGRIPLLSPGGALACVFTGSLDTLVDRGWLEGPTKDVEQGSETHPDGRDRASDASDAREPSLAGQSSTSAPRLPNLHHNTLAVSKYPVVGEVAEMTFTVAYSDSSVFGPGAVHPLASLVVGVTMSGRTQPDSVFDVVSNIGTGDPGVFRPYDPDNVTTVAQPGETYTVKAKFKILKEGVARVVGLGLDYDFLDIHMAVSKNKSMPLDEYAATGQTYLDHMMARGQEVQPPQFTEYDVGLSVPTHALNKTTLLGEYNTMLSSFANGYIELNYTEDQIVDELFYWGYLRSDIREFFVHIMGYTEEQADAVRMGDDLLAAAYRWGEGDTDEIVHDMLTRRNYTAAEVRDFFREYMWYTDDEDVALILNATAAARTQAGAAGQQQQRAGLFTVSGRVHGPGYSTTAPMPVHGIRVCAYDHDASTMRTSLLRTSASTEACTVTAQSGAYTS